MEGSRPAQEKQLSHTRSPGQLGLLMMAPNVQIPGEEDACESGGRALTEPLSPLLFLLLVLIPEPADKLLGTADSPQRQTQQ